MKLSLECVHRGRALPWEWVRSSRTRLKVSLVLAISATAWPVVMRVTLTPLMLYMFNTLAPLCATDQGNSLTRMASPRLRLVGLSGRWSTVATCPMKGSSLRSKPPLTTNPNTFSGLLQASKH